METLRQKRVVGIEKSISKISEGIRSLENELSISFANILIQVLKSIIEEVERHNINNEGYYLTQAELITQLNTPEDIKSASLKELCNTLTGQLKAIINPDANKEAYIPKHNQIFVDEINNCLVKIEEISRKSATVGNQESRSDSGNGGDVKKYIEYEHYTELRRIFLEALSFIEKIKNIIVILLKNEVIKTLFQKVKTGETLSDEERELLRNATNIFRTSINSFNPDNIETLIDKIHIINLQIKAGHIQKEVIPSFIYEMSSTDSLEFESGGPIHDISHLLINLKNIANYLSLVQKHLEDDDQISSELWEEIQNIFIWCDASAAKILNITQNHQFTIDNQED